MIPIINTGPLPAAQINNAQLSGESSKLLLETATLPSKLPALLLGELVTARVADQLGNNQLAVLIKNALFTLNMPADMAFKGDSLQLKVASISPLTFSLQNSSKEASQAPQENSVQVALSPASKALGQLLAAAQEGETGAVLENQHTAKPVVVNVAQQPVLKVAEELQQGIKQSGLFYESHLKDFANGRTTLADIQQEPQAKMSPALNQAEQLAPSLRPQLQELGHLVQRQLNGLEHQQLQFQGMAWPGQPMQLVIEQDKVSEDRQGNGAEELTTWSTSLALHLPALGGMSARIRLVGNAVQVSFAAEEKLAASLINRQAGRLESGLAAAGLSLASLVVKDYEQEKPGE
ncbi:flagellar hook-length control protein FliK [Neisseriaceae bacterium TC5R-5]|nr:flagellar hook-length control protein FliK [Neisseriaceae bacterium TC5R-5]